MDGNFSGGQKEREREKSDNQVIYTANLQSYLMATTEQI